MNKSLGRKHNKAFKYVKKINNLLIRNIEIKTTLTSNFSPSRPLKNPRFVYSVSRLWEDDGYVKQVNLFEDSLSISTKVIKVILFD